MIEAIIGHLVGDYLLQNDWMALNKKRSTFICAIHCAIWTASVMTFAGWRGSFYYQGQCSLVATVLFATHFIQDRTSIIRQWMSVVGQDQFATGPCSPWSIIVVDNVWHIVTICAVCQTLARGMG